VIEACRRTSLFVETSTIGPRLARRIADEAGAKGAAYLDAPVSGGVERAIDGSLTIMVGGGEAELERAMPIL
jgi:3-hydroxyisobutyrate dehydrogenase